MSGVASGSPGTTALSRVLSSAGLSGLFEVPVQSELASLKESANIVRDPNEAVTGVVGATVAGGLFQGIGEVAKPAIDAIGSFSKPIVDSIKEYFAPTKNIYTKEGTEELIDTAVKAGLDPTPLEVTKIIHDFNPYGDGYNANAALSQRLSKVELDLDANKPIAVVPEGAPQPPPPPGFDCLLFFVLASLTSLLF